MENSSSFAQDASRSASSTSYHVLAALVTAFFLPASSSMMARYSGTFL